MTYEKDIPDFALVPAKEPGERILIPITQDAVYCPMQVTNITSEPKTAITIEEDMLVPDTRPDLREILLITGKAHMANPLIELPEQSEEAVSLTGDVELQTLYLPEKGGVHGPVISITGRVTFREQWHISLPQGASMLMEAQVEHIDWMVINERKFRVKITLAIQAAMYQDCKIQLFEGLSGESLETLREKKEITSAAVRKKDVLSIREDLERKEGQPEPQEILMSRISLVENYRQTTAEKVVINGFVCVNLLYRAAGEEGGQICHQQDRVEFTQFIPLPEAASWSGSRVSFDDSDLKVRLAQNEEGDEVFRLEGDIATWVTLYQNVEREIITDAYHKEKQFVCDFKDTDCRTLAGTGTAEATIREIITPENTQEDVEEILYVLGETAGSASHGEPGKIVTEGLLRCKIICRGSGETEQYFTLRQELPFRCVAAAPQIRGEETIREKIYLKNLWAEKISGRQLELNASLMACSEAMSQVPLPVLKNPAFEEGKEGQPGQMAVYIVRSGDTLWSVAKRFQSTVDTICQVNQMENGVLQPGQKLLILR